MAPSSIVLSLYCPGTKNWIIRGYGNISPCNNAGRAVTSVYAAFGVPLMFLVLADLGKLFTKIMKFIFRYYRRYYKTGTCREHSSAITENKPLQYMTVSWRTVRQDKASNTTKSGNNLQNDVMENQVTTLTIHNDDLYKNLDFMNPDEKNHKHVEVEDDFNLPITLAIALDVVYMIIGGFLLSYYEDWTYFEAFYFIFISMTTIGLGDYAPETQKYLMGTFIYLVFGLMLTSMCINVIQEKITATFQKGKVRIGDNTVLNVSSLLQDEDHRSRAQKLDPQVYNNCYAFKLTMHKNSMCSLTSNSITQNYAKKSRGSVSRNISDFGLKSDSNKEMFLKVPQNRFTFYDSPYNTVQDDNECTITSLRKYRL
ncbi:TWiK family of potassium channels protein 9-like [Uloborus diversus]|uniref:TWiK family of potassium channels protein 9-like n=1 Tax=Uloborus diversus TaxID=327109 RepID=UPI00240A7D50|nr:TWiK family of potassium channels protein 9-like [Uloborus diversus]